jgi:hypothetical protein
MDLKLEIYTLEDRRLLCEPPENRRFRRIGGMAIFSLVEHSVCKDESHHSSAALIQPAPQEIPIQQELATSFEPSQADDSSTCCLAAALSSAMRFSI